MEVDHGEPESHDDLHPLDHRIGLLLLLLPLHLPHQLIDLPRSTGGVIGTHLREG